MVKNPQAMQETHNSGDMGLIPGSGRFDPGSGGNDSPLQCSFLKNPMDREAWKATKGYKESDMTDQLNTHLASLSGSAF